MPDVTWLPPGKQTFVDINGKPLVGGKVYHFVPNTSVFKDTWQDEAGDVLNTNPVILNARGQAIIYGEGLYRQRLEDVDGNEIWDQITGFGGIGSGSGLVDSVIVAEGTTFADTTLAITVAGYYEPGDGGAALWVRVDSQPSDIGKFQSADGGWWALSEPVWRLEMVGAKGDGTTNDTAFFQGAMQSSHAVSGTPGRSYLVGQGVSVTNGARIVGGLKIELLTGAGGFNSVETVTGRYGINNCLLCWSGQNGCYIENLEVYGDGTKEVVVIPLAINGGMTTKAAEVYGIYVHDTQVINGALATNGLGPAGMIISGLRVEDCGTNLPGGASGYWTRNGVHAGAIVNPTGWIHDGDLSMGGLSPSGYVEFLDEPTCDNIFLGGAAYALEGGQSDFITLAGTGTSQNGGYIPGVSMARVWEGIDCQQCNWKIGPIQARNIGFLPVKFIHGAQNNIVESINVQNAGRGAVGFFGSDSVTQASLDNVVNSITGYGIGDYVLDIGNPQAATSSTLTLRAGASPFNNFYCPGSFLGTVIITAGTGMGQERTFSSYNGTTKVISGLSSNWSVTPNSGSTYKIIPFSERAAVIFELDTLASNHNNAAFSIALRDTGSLDYIVRSNLTAANSNNTAVVSLDMGCQKHTVESGGNNTLRVMPGSSQRATTRLAMSADQTPSDNVATLVNFDTIAQDTYVVNNTPNVQGNVSNKAIDARLSGPKMINVQLRLIDVKAGDELSLQIRRATSIIAATSDKITEDTDFTQSISFPYYQPEDQFNIAAHENSYTIWVQHNPTGRLIGHGLLTFFGIDG